MGQKVSARPEEGASQLLKMSPVLNRSLMELMEAMSGVVTSMGSRESSRKLEQILKKHPEGTLYYLHGSTLALFKRWAEARAPLLAAVKAPSMGHIKRISMSMLLLCDAALIEACENKDEKLRLETREHFEEFLRLGPVGKADYILCGKVAIYTGEFYKAQEFLALALKHQVGDPVDVLQHWMVVEKTLGNYNRVLELTGRILKIEPKNADALKFRADALASLQTIVNAAGGR
jgi:tetratricopeptide (TPR) repeat protein